MFMHPVLHNNVHLGPILLACVIDELLSLQQRLQQAISAKVALEDRVAKAEKQVM